MRILVTGLVGNYIKNIVSNQYKNHTFIFLSRSDCDLINREAVIQYFNKKYIDEGLEITYNLFKENYKIIRK